MTGKSKYLILVVGIISFGLMLVGGTYAFLSFTATVTNATYNGTSTCFLVDYGATVSTDALPISGVLFQSATPQGGLLSTVTMKINDSCSVSGRGYIYLNVVSNSNDDDSTDLRLIGDAHCEHKKLERTIKCAKTDSSATTTLKNFWTTCSTTGAFAVTSSNCSTVYDAVWKADNATPPLKYAVYNSGGTMVSSGYVNQVGNITLYDNVELTHTAASYSVYIWLDGNMADNTYVDMPFEAYLHAGATQTE